MLIGLCQPWRSQIWTIFASCHVYMVDTQPPQRCVYTVKHMLARMTAGVLISAHVIADLGRHHDFFAPRKTSENAADDFFSDASRIEIRQVDEIHSGLQRVADDGFTPLLVKNPRFPLRGAHIHSAETQARYFQA